MADQVVARPTGPSRLERWFPIGAWLPKYDWGSSFAPDLIAAISVAALLIPESMGYASARDGVLAEIGEDHIYDSVQAAVAASNGAAEQQDKGPGGISEASGRRKGAR